MDLGFFSHPLQQLPCKDLLDLKLTGRCEEEIEATCGFRDVIQGCPKLTWLELDCNISDPEGAFVDCLCSLAHLQHLEVITYEPYIEMRAAAMLHLNQLTYLNFEKLSLGSLNDLGNLTNLQELHLVVADDEVAVGPRSVTGLAFPGLAFPASLKTLVLVSSVEAAILSLAPPGLQDLRIGWDVEGPEEGPDSFLCHVGRMQNLTRLSLQSSHTLDWPTSGPAYSALTASSNLIVLELCDAHFPRGIWPHVFPDSRKLPHLTALVVSGSIDNGELISPPPPWCAADLRSLVSCCPSLCELETDCVQPGLDVSELHKLTSLTRMFLAYCFGLDSLDIVTDCMRGLSAVTQLHSLLLFTYIPERSPACLWPLTSLTTLTSLDCKWRDVSGFSLCTQVNIWLHAVGNLAILRFTWANASPHLDWMLDIPMGTA